MVMTERTEPIAALSTNDLEAVTGGALWMIPVGIAAGGLAAYDIYSRRQDCRAAGGTPETNLLGGTTCKR